jgi:hypothetical protein
MNDLRSGIEEKSKEHEEKKVETNLYSTSFVRCAKIMERMVV